LPEESKIKTPSYSFSLAALKDTLQMKERLAHSPSHNSIAGPRTYLWTVTSLTFLLSLLSGRAVSLLTHYLFTFRFVRQNYWHRYSLPWIDMTWLTDPLPISNSFTFFRNLIPGATSPLQFRERKEESGTLEGKTLLLLLLIELCKLLNSDMKSIHPFPISFLSLLVSLLCPSPFYSLKRHKSIRERKETEPIL